MLGQDTGVETGVDAGAAQAAVDGETDPALTWLSDRNERALFAVTLIVACIWAVWASWAAPRGFDPFDEAWYVSTYRDAVDRDPLATVAPFLIGPLLDLFGGSIIALRVLKLVAWLGIGALLGASAATWINSTPGLREVTRSSIGALFATAVMVVYAVFPPTPSYNDLSIGLLVVPVALALRLSVATDLGRRSAKLQAGLIGALLVLAGLNKATTAVVTAIAVVLVLILGSPTSMPWRRHWRRLVGWLVVGACGCLLFLHLFVVDLIEFARATQWTAGMIRRTTLRDDVVWERQQQSFDQMVTLVRDDFWPVIVLVALAVACHFLNRRRTAAAVAVAALVLGVVVVVDKGYYRGGWQHLATQPVALVVLLTSSFGLLLIRVRRAPRVSIRVVLLAVVLATLPFVQGVGSNIPLLYLAVSLAPAWLFVALIAAVAQPRPGAAHGAATVVLLAMWALMLSVSWTSLVWEPVRVWTPLWDQTVSPDVDGLEGLHVDAASAAFYASADDLIWGNWTGDGRPLVIALTDAPGAVVASNSTTIAGGWFSQLDPDRTAEMLRRECAAPGWEGRSADALLLLRDFGLTDPVVTALKECGLDVFADYGPVGVLSQPMGYYPFDPTLTLWVRTATAD